MGRYDALYRDIYSIFSSTNWIAEGIATFPNNYTQTDMPTEFIRVSVVASGESNVLQKSGQLMIDIFFPTGGGEMRAIQIADKLDTYLANKVVAMSEGSNTQFMSSSLTSMGVDRDNASLYRHLYTLPFNYYGV